MTLVKLFAMTPSTALSASWKNTARVEKIHLSNALDGKRRDAQQQENFASAKLARVGVSRNETMDDVPERDERRLVPTFVAQVLAQAMPGHSVDARSALLAYRNGTAQVTRLNDRDL